MSFYCRYMTGRDYCSRRDLECRPGAERCVLHGRVVFAGDAADGSATESRGGTSRRSRSRRAEDPNGASAADRHPPENERG